MRPCRGGVGSRGCPSRRSSGPCRRRSPLPPSLHSLLCSCALCLLFSVRGRAWVPLGCGSAGRDVQAEGWAQGQFGEAAALPSCWVCSCVVLPVCLYVSPAFLVGEPRKPGCWSLVPDAGSVSGGLRPCTAGSLSSDWLVLLPPAWHFPLGDWFLSEQAGPGALRRPHGVPLLTAALGPFLAEARLCHPELGALLPRLFQDPEPLPSARTARLP